MNEGKSVSEIIGIIVTLAFFIAVIVLQTKGYYDKVYISVVGCEDEPIAIKKSTKMEWDQTKERIEQLNKQGGFSFNEDLNFSFDKVCTEEVC